MKNFESLTKTEQFDVIYELAKDVVANYTPQKMDGLFILAEIAGYDACTLIDCIEETN